MGLKLWILASMMMMMMMIIIILIILINKYNKGLLVSEIDHLKGKVQ